MVLWVEVEIGNGNWVTRDFVGDESNVLGVGDSHCGRIRPIRVASSRSMVLFGRVIELEMLPLMGSGPIVFNLYVDFYQTHYQIQGAGYRSIVDFERL